MAKNVSSTSSPYTFTLTGTNVLLSGGNGVDVIYADTEFTNKGYGATNFSYEIVAGNGADIVWGSSRRDVIWGDSKNDSDASANGADQLHGGGGNDDIYGGNGADLIWGDAGGDDLYGGRGGDIFAYNFTSDSNATTAHQWQRAAGDWIKDFSKSEGDKLDLSAISLGGGSPMLQWSSSGPSAYGVWIGAYTGDYTSGAAVNDGKGGSIVYADTTGDGQADVAIRVAGTIDGNSFIGVNHAPTVANDTINVLEDYTVAASVAGNDSDSDGDKLAYSIAGGPVAGLTLNANGSYMFNAGNAAYQHLAAGATQNVVTTLNVSDGHGGMKTETLTITVTGVNDAATIGGNLTGSVTEDANTNTATGTLTVSDVDDGQSTMIASEQNGQYGHFSMNASGNWTYTLDNGLADGLNVGDTPTETFTVHSADGTAQTVTVTVNGANDAAVFGEGGPGVDEGTVDETGSGGSGNGGDGGDGPVLSLSIESVDSGTTTGHIDVTDVDSSATITSQDNVATDHGTFSIDANGDWTFSVDQDNDAVQALNDGDTLTETITVHAADGTPHDITITIDGANDAPETSGGSGAGDEDSTITGAVTATDVDDATGLVFSYDSGSAPAGFSMDTSGNWSLDAGNAAYQHLGTGQSDEVAVTYTVTDPHGGSSSETITITVNGVNDAPEQTGTAATLADGTEDTVYTVSAADLLAGWTDAEGDALSVTGLSCDHGTIQDNGDDTYTVTLVANYNGAATLSYGVTDGTATSSASLGFSVAAVNDPPALTGNAATLAGGTEDTSYTVSASDLLAGWTDVEGDSLSVTGLSCDHGSVTDNGDNTYTVTFAADYNGAATLTYGVTDGTDTTPASLGFSVAAVNDAPALTGTAATLAGGTEDTSYTVSASDLLAGWTDVDGDALGVSGLACDHGTVVDNGNDTYTITLAANYNGPITLTYNVGDGTTTVAASLNANIASVNDAPTAPASNSVTTSEDNATAATAIGASDVDGDTLNYSTKADAGPAHGSVGYDQTNGTFTYTPDANYNGSDSFTVAIDDGHGGVANQIVNVTVTSVDDPGTINGAKTGSVTEDAVTNTATGVLTLSDVDGPYGFAAQTNAAGTYGSFSVTAAGAWTYTLDNSASATDALSTGDTKTEIFTVNANDGASTTISVTVNGHTDGPIYVAPSEYTGSDDGYNFDNLGLTGPQTLTGNSTSDLIYGGPGDDKINGNGGADRLFGGSGNDDMDGNVDNDTLYGGSGRDVLTGSNGDDKLIGNGGADTLTGSNGNDTFIFFRQQDTGDLITDFKHGGDADKIDLSGQSATDFLHLSNFYAAASGWKGDLGANPNAPATLGAHEFGYHYDATLNQTIIYVGTDSTPGADMEIKLVGNVALTTSDFILHI